MGSFRCLLRLWPPLRRSLSLRLTDFMAMAMAMAWATATHTSMARGVPMLNLNLRQRLRLMLRPTTLCMATTHPGTVPDTTVMASSMARGVLMPMLNLRRRLRLMLKLTTLFTATIPSDMLPTPTSTCMARGVLNPPLMLNLTTATATGLAMPTDPTMAATTTASRGVENRNQMLWLTALNKLVFQLKK